jgi:hypothetical protein
LRVAGGLILDVHVAGREPVGDELLPELADALLRVDTARQEPQEGMVALDLGALAGVSSWYNFQLIPAIDCAMSMIAR